MLEITFAVTDILLVLVTVNTFMANVSYTLTRIVWSLRDCDVCILCLENSVI